MQEQQLKQIPIHRLMVFDRLGRPWDAAVISLIVQYAYLCLDQQRCLEARRTNDSEVSAWQSMRCPSNKPDWYYSCSLGVRFRVRYRDECYITFGFVRASGTCMIPRRTESNGWTWYKDLRDVISIILSTRTAATMEKAMSSRWKTQTLIDTDSRRMMRTVTRRIRMHISLVNKLCRMMIAVLPFVVPSYFLALFPCSLALFRRSLALLPCPFHQII